MADIIPFRRPVPAPAPMTDYEIEVLCALSCVLRTGREVHIDIEQHLEVRVERHPTIRVPFFHRLLEVMQEDGVPADVLGREIARRVMQRSGIENDIPRADTCQFFVGVAGDAA